MIARRNFTRRTRREPGATCLRAKATPSADLRALYTPEAIATLVEAALTASSRRRREAAYLALVAGGWWPPAFPYPFEPAQPSTVKLSVEYYTEDPATGARRVYSLSREFPVAGGTRWQDTARS